MLKFFFFIAIYLSSFLIFTTQAQNSERIIVQYKIDLNDSINRLSFGVQVYDYYKLWSMLQPSKFIGVCNNLYEGIKRVEN